MNNILEYKGIKYEIILGPKGRKPCDLCEMRKECEADEYEELFMLCGCEFCNQPYYCKRI